MKNYKRIGIILFALLMVLSLIPISAMAENVSVADTSLYQELLSTGELERINSNDAIIYSDKEQPITQSVSSIIDNNNVLEELSLSSNEVESFYIADYEYNSDIAYEVKFDNGAVISYDKNMSIVAYSNFDRNSAYNQVEIIDNDSVINALKNEYNIDESYLLDVSEDNGDIIYYWEKEDINGVRNTYDSLSVRIDGNSNTIVTFNRFDDGFPEKQEINISEETAKSIALKLKDEFNTVTSCTKEYVKPNFFWNEEGIAYNEVDLIRLAYNVVVDNIYLISIDVETGEIIGGDIYKAVNNAGTYAYSGFAFATESRNLAKTAFSKLGYTNSVALTGDANLRSSVLNFVTNDSKAYGFYIDCHGSSTKLATDSTLSKIILKTSEVKGNWHFVFLDACETAENSNWPNAFKINSSYSKRAFLGWGTSVTVGNAYSFDKYFWQETTEQKHSNNIRDAAVWAAAQVPGSGTTPIRFYGDRSYNGKAY